MRVRRLVRLPAARSRGALRPQCASIQPPHHPLPCALSLVPLDWSAHRSWQLTHPLPHPCAQTVCPFAFQILAYQVYPESSMTETELPYDQGNKAVEIPTLASEEGDPDAKRKVRTTGSGKARTYRVAGADAKGKTVSSRGAGRGQEGATGCAGSGYRPANVAHAQCFPAGHCPPRNPCLQARSPTSSSPLPASLPRNCPAAGGGPSAGL